MRELVTLFIATVTIVPMLIIALIVSPFGLADDVADGYSNWLIEICSCEEQTNDE